MWLEMVCLSCVIAALEMRRRREVKAGLFRGLVLLLCRVSFKTFGVEECCTYKCAWCVDCEECFLLQLSQ